MLGRAGLELRPVERDHSELHKSHPLTQLEDLHKQCAQRIEMNATKLADAGVIGMRVAGEHAECDVLMRALLDLARRRQTDAVRIQKQRRHHARIVRREPAALALVVRDNGRQVELRDGLQNEIREVIGRQPVKRTRR